MGLGSPVGVGVIVGVGVTVGVGSSVGVGVAGFGFSDMVEFCGSEVSLVTKSDSLSSVSLPFPNSSSGPPEPILSEVELTRAFLSILPFAVGLAENDAVSKSITPVPNPTLSTTVVPASEKSVTVLLVVSALEEAE